MPKIFIAGRDKPHRCPDCWTSSYIFIYGKHGHWWVYNSFNPIARTIYRLRLKFPRKCLNCGSVTLGTFPQRIYGEQIWPKETAPQSED